MADTNDLDNIIQQLLGGVTLVSPTGTGSVGTTAYTPFSQGSAPSLLNFQSILSKPPTTTSTWNPTLFSQSDQPAPTPDTTSPPATTTIAGTEGTIDTSEYTPFQTPPPIAPDVNVTTGESAAEWIQRWLPNSAAFWQNFAQADVAQGDQLMQQAMEAYNARMNELAGLLNQGISNIGTSREDYLGSLGDATSVYSIGLDQALNVLQELADKSDLSNYMQNIQTGTIPQTTADMMDQIRQNMIDEAQYQLQHATQQNVNDVLESLGAKNMMDSSRMGQALRGIAYDQGNLMNSVMRDIENQWMERRLQEPYNQLQAAVASLTGYEPLRDIATTKLSGGANLSDMLAAQGLAGWQSQRQNLADIMQYGLQQAEMPKTFYQMAYTKPTSAVEQQSAMMNQLLNIWDTLLNAELQREAISAERDIADLQYDDSFDFWDILF
jgi:hypothetical protein